MTIEQFLQLWSRHNTTIIEVLIALILVFVIYLAFRTFFGDSEATESSSSSQFNAAEIEKTLQKILQTQSTQRVGFVENSGAPSAGDVANSVVQSAEVEQLKTLLSEKEKSLAQLNEQLQKASAASAEAGSAGPSLAEKKALDDKIKDLESRLAEYEIISEDIADLSFYKEENQRLQKEISSVKGGAPEISQPPLHAPAPTPNETPASESAAPPPAPAASASSADPVPTAAPAEISVASSASAPEGATTPAVDPTATGAEMAPDPMASIVDPPSDPAASAAPVAEALTPAPASQSSETSVPTAAAPAEPPADTTAKDDDLMKEFAAAVEEQKQMSQKAPTAAGKSADTQGLMNEFENFVKKE